MAIKCQKSLKIQNLLRELDTGWPPVNIEGVKSGESA